MATIGAFLVAPGLHVWFGALARATSHLKGTTAVVVSVAADQFIWAPPFVCAFMACVLTLEVI